MDSSIVKGHVILTLEFHREGRYWVGVCRELGTATDGVSLERVKDELSKLVALHLDGLEAIEERTRVFKERGIRFYTAGLPSQIPSTLPVSDGDTLVEAKPLAIEALAV